MPGRNVLKEQAPHAYYHVYARGVDKQKIFHEADDYKYFIKLFERYLSDKQLENSLGYVYPTFNKKIELLAYCLMSNHFHILVYQEELPYLEKFMHSLMTSYSRFYNLKYKRTGPLFETRYRAAHINQEQYLDHISRYIHLNPRNWRTYRYSSLRYYMGESAPKWFKPSKIMDLFTSREKYLEFVEDYEEQRDILDELKHVMAEN